MVAFYLHFSVSGVDTWIFTPPLVALVVSALTSMGGISGVFLLLPYQFSIIGFNTPGVSATNFVYNIVAIPSGVYRYMKEGRMAWPLTRIVIVGTLPGAFIGNYLRVLYLLNPKAFKFFVGCMLLYIGARLLYELTARSQKGKQEMKALETKFNDHVIKILNFQAALISVNGFSRLSLTVHCDPCRFPDTLADVREALARVPAVRDAVARGFLDIEPIRLSPENWFTTGAAKRTLIDRRQERSTP